MIIFGKCACPVGLWSLEESIGIELFYGNEWERYLVCERYYISWIV